MALTYSQVSQLTPVICGLKNQGLSPLSIIKLIKLTKALKETFKERTDAVNIIFDNYGIKKERTPDGKGFIMNFSGHEKEAEIRVALNEIDTQTVNIAPLNFLSEEELVKASFGSDMNTLLFVSDFLVDESKPYVEEQKRESKIVRV